MVELKKALESITQTFIAAADTVGMLSGKVLALYRYDFDAGERFPTR